MKNWSKEEKERDIKIKNNHESETLLNFFELQTPKTHVWRKK